MARAQEELSSALGEPIHMSHTSLKTLSKQTLEHDHLAAKMKKISSSNSGYSRRRKER